MQVRDAVTDHGCVDVLGPGHFMQRLARTRAPEADTPGLSVSQIGQPWCMPQRLHKQMSQVGGCAVAPQHIGRDDMGDKSQLVFRDRTARHE